MKKVLAVLFLTLFAVSAMAADWGLYGSLRFKTFWVSQDSDLAAGGDSDTDLREFGLQGNSRVGAKVKINERFSARLELSIKGASGGNSVGTRLFYGTYDFGPAKIHIGQMWTPLNVTTFDQVSKDDKDLYGWGAFYTGRREAIMVEASGFRFAIVRPVPQELKLEVNGKAVDDTKFFDNFDFNVPRLEADYTLKLDPVSARMFAGFQTVQSDVMSDYDINSYVVGLDVSGNMGIAGFALTGYYGRNALFMNASGPYRFGSNDKLLPTTADEDFEDYGFAGAIKLFPADNIKVEVGAGYAATDNDLFHEVDDQFSVYGNVKYTIAKGFFIQPEVAYYDYLDDPNGDDEGSELYFGAKWQMDF